MGYIRNHKLKCVQRMGRKMSEAASWIWQWVRAGEAGVDWSSLILSGSTQILKKVQVLRGLNSAHLWKVSLQASDLSLLSLPVPSICKAPTARGAWLDFCSTVICSTANSTHNAWTSHKVIILWSHFLPAYFSLFPYEIITVFPSSVIYFSIH